MISRMMQVIGSFSRMLVDVSVMLARVMGRGGFKEIKDPVSTQKKKVLDTLSHTQTHTAGCVVGAEMGGWRRKKLTGRQTLSDYFMCGFVVLLGHTLWV